MWTTINAFLKTVDNFVWGVPLMVLILCGGILLTVRLGVLQMRRLPLALKWMIKNEEGGKGEISSFAALCTALSATIGTGNIVGVATAVCAGGPGALFWMIVAAFFGMATKFSEGLLAIKYRVVDKDGHSLGGPFYYIEQGMGSKWKWLAKIFAFFGVCVGLFGIGTFSQVNGIASAIQNFFDPNKVHTMAIPGIGTYSWTVVIASLILAFCVGAVLIGGIKRIASVSQIVVPFMAVAYFVFALILIICNITKVPAAVVTVVQGAFHPRAVTGGVVGSMFVAMQNGVARGIFSNEAGLGSAPIAAAAAQTNESVDVTAVADKLKDGIEFKDELAELDEAKIEKIIGISADSYTKAKVYVSSSGGTAEEIDCFEAKDADSAKAIADTLTARVESQKKVFENYVPEEMTKLGDPVLVTNGNYVYLCLSNDNDKAKEIIG